MKFNHTFLILLVQLTLLRILIKTENEFDDDATYRWYSIVSIQKQCECELAIEIPTTRANCPLTKLISCPYDPKNVYQHWRWDGMMLKSRLNGLVWDLESYSRNIVLGHAINSTDQHFKYNSLSKNIYPRRFDTKRVVDIEGNKKSFIGAEIITFNKNAKRIPNQMFVFRPVP